MNNMNSLLNKIERRLGTSLLNLPEKLDKNSWHTIIEEDTIPTFSRYFPNQIRAVLTKDDYDPRDGYFVIDRMIPNDIKILGIQDLDWSTFGTDGSAFGQTYGYGYWDIAGPGIGVDNVMEIQMAADLRSIYNSGIFLEFKDPNKVKFSNSVGGNIHNMIDRFPVNVFIMHANNLATISPTKMELFENLATADVATFLYENLKHFDGLETVFAGIELHLDSIKEKADKRDDYVNELRDGYISAANDHQPLIITI